jgi:hypothetical protein
MDRRAAAQAELVPSPKKSSRPPRKFSENRHYRTLPLGYPLLKTPTFPTQPGNQRRAGVDLNKVRMRRVVAAIVALSPKPAGFTVSDLAQKVCEIAGPEQLSVQDPQQKHRGTSRQVTPIPAHRGRCEKVDGRYCSPRSRHQVHYGRCRTLSLAAAQNHSSPRPALPELARGTMQDFRNLGPRGGMKPSVPNANMLVE